VNFCPNCGQPLSESAKRFCTDCGAPLTDMPATTGLPETGETQFASPNPKMRDSLPLADPEGSATPRALKKPLIVGASVIVMLLVVSVGAFVLSPTSEGGSTAAAPTPTVTSQQVAPAASTPATDTTHTLFFRPEGEDAMEFAGVKVTGSQAEGYVVFPDTVYCFRGTVSGAGLDGTALVSGNLGSELESVSWSARGSGAEFELLSGPGAERLIPTTENGLPSFFTSVDPKKEFSECAKEWAAGPRRFH